MEPFFGGDIRFGVLHARRLRGDPPQPEVLPGLHRTEARFPLPEESGQVPILDQRIGPEGLVARVNDDVVRIGGAHHGRQDRGRTGLPRVGKRMDVPHVADRAVARMNLRDLGEPVCLQEVARGPECRRGPHGHVGDGDPLLQKQPCRFHRHRGGLDRQAVHTLPGRFPARLVRIDALEVDAREAAELLCHTQSRLARPNAEPVSPRVDLQKRGNRPADVLSQQGDPFGLLHHVHHHGDLLPRFIEEPPQDGQFVIAVKRVGDEDVVDSGIGHAEGPFDRSDLDAAGAAGYLHLGDVRAFVDLRMGPQPDSRLAGEPRHRGDIRLQNIQVDNDGGGGDFADGCSRFGHDILLDDFSVPAGIDP